MPKGQKDVVSASGPGKTNTPSRGKKIVNFLRTPFTKVGVTTAEHFTFRMKNPSNVTPPTIGDTYNLPNNGRNQDQLKTETFTFAPADGGKTQTLEGFRLDAQPGKPTIVFFGGNEFNRSKEHYQQAIQEMAYECKQKGLGFAVYDYPKDATEQRMREHVVAVQQHLTNQGVSMDKQAYAGFSMGSFSATHAANINHQCAGLHITSGFSSARMAQKEGMGPIGVLVNKSELRNTMDVVSEAQQLRARLGQSTPGQMPIYGTYADAEDFGKTNNRHMSPLMDALRDNTGSGVMCISDNKMDAKEDNHMRMLKSPTHTASFQGFVLRSEAYVRAQQQQVQQGQGQQHQVVNPPPQTTVTQTTPTVNQGTIVSQIPPQILADNDSVGTSNSQTDITPKQNSGQVSSVRKMLEGGSDKTTSKGIKRSDSLDDLSSRGEVAKLRSKFEQTKPKQTLKQSQGTSQKTGGL